MKSLKTIKKRYDATTTAMDGQSKSLITTPITYQQAGAIYYKEINLKERLEEELTALIEQQEQYINSGLSSNSTIVQDISNQIKAKETHLDSVGDDDMFTEATAKEVVVWKAQEDPLKSNVKTFLGLPSTASKTEVNSAVFNPVAVDSKEADAKVLVDKGKYSAQNFFEGTTLVNPVQIASYTSGTSGTSGGIGGGGLTEPDNSPTIALNVITPAGGYDTQDNIFNISIQVNNWDSGLDNPHLNLFYRWENMSTWTLAQFDTEIQANNVTNYFDINPSGQTLAMALQIYGEVYYPPSEEWLSTGIIPILVQQAYEGVPTPPNTIVASPNADQVIPVFMKDIPGGQGVISHGFELFDNGWNDTGGYHITSTIRANHNVQFNYGGWNAFGSWMQEQSVAQQYNLTDWFDLIHAQAPNSPMDYLSGRGADEMKALLEERSFRLTATPGVDEDGNQKSWPSLNHNDSNTFYCKVYFRQIDDDGNPMHDWVQHRTGTTWGANVLPSNHAMSYGGLHMTNADGTTTFHVNLPDLVAPNGLVQYKIDWFLFDDGSDPLYNSAQDSHYFYIDGRVHTKPRVHYILEESDPDGNSNYLNGEVKIKMQIEPLTMFPPIFTNVTSSIVVQDADSNVTMLDNVSQQNRNTYAEEDWMLLPTNTSTLVEATFNTSDFVDGNYDIIIANQVFHFNPNGNYGADIMLCVPQDTPNYSNNYSLEVESGIIEPLKGYSSNQIHATQIAIYNEQLDPPPNDDDSSFDDSTSDEEVVGSYVPSILPDREWFQGTNVLALQDKGLSNRQHIFWRRTPWISVNQNDNAFINNVNLDYRSNVPLKVKIYGDYDSEPITTINFDSTGGNRKLISKRVQARAKTFQFDIGVQSYMTDLGSNFPSDVRIRVYDLEIDVDEFK